MGTILEIQEHVQSGKYWSWIQLSHTWIWVWGANDIYDGVGWYLNELINNNERNGNNIGDSGGCSIGEVLKVNSTLTSLNLGVKS